jgi:hypothetical protein
VNHGGVRIIAHLFNIYKMKKFLKNLYLKTFKQELLEETLETNHMFHIERIHFMGWKKWAEYLLILVYKI